MDGGYTDESALCTEYYGHEKEEHLSGHLALAGAPAMAFTRKVHGRNTFSKQCTPTLSRKVQGCSFPNPWGKTWKSRKVNNTKHYRGFVFTFLHIQFELFPWAWKSFLLDLESLSP